MEKENKTFNEVLYDAKMLGYAESNPSADLNGSDVSAKLKILSSLCFNSFLNDNIHVEGINNIDKIDIDNIRYSIETQEFFQRQVEEAVNTLINKNNTESDKAFSWFMN